MEVSKSEFSERFPALHDEMFEKKQSQTLQIDEVQASAERDEKQDSEKDKLNENVESGIRTKISDPLEHYSPSVEDFLARASTNKEALDIIDYLIQRNELSSEKAREFRELIHQEGVRALGPKRTPGYYDRFAREERLKKQMERRVVRKEPDKK
ncbi:MAG: DUF2095 family protein [Candidatus Heimdallarchaeota archaeon]